MRSFTWTLVLTALFYPIFVLSRDYGEGRYSGHPHQPNYPEYSAEDSEDQDSQSSIKKKVKIEVKIKMKDKSFGSGCQNRKESKCREGQSCESQKDSCKSGSECEGGEEPNCREGQSCESQKDSCKSGSECEGGEEPKCRDEQSCGSQEDSCIPADINLYGFQCGKKFHDQIEIIKAAKAGCSEIRVDSQNRIFPAGYTASDYWIPGPYAEWPLKRNGHWWNKFSRDRDRLIMTMDCKVVGAVTRGTWDSSYKQCKYEHM